MRTFSYKYKTSDRARFMLALVTLFSTCMGVMYAQRNIQPFPKGVFTAKTVAIVNNTGNQAVSDGAIEALKRWGKFTLAEDADTADLTLTFDKKSEHDGSNSQTTGADGKQNYSYSVTFSSTILMKVAIKGADRSFYTTTTTESKKKAGAKCVTDFQAAYLDAR